MDVRVLASGSGGNAYHVRASGSELLLEAGIRYPDIQRALDHRVTSLEACLITHEHQDHAKAAAALARAGVDVYATEGTLEAIGLSGHRAHAIKAGVTVMLGGWKVRPFEAVHDAVEPVNFLIQNGSEKLLYVTDTAYCPYRFGSGLTTVMVEANYSLELLRRAADLGAIPLSHKARVMRNHMSIGRAIGLLQANDLSRVREIILLHLSAGNSDEAAFVEMVRRATGKPVRVAEERTTA